MLIDTHAHIASECFKEYRQEIIDDILKGEPSILFEAGSTMQDALLVDELSKNIPNIFGYIGVHPHFVDEPIDYKVLETIIKNNKHIRAIGEIGLDYCRSNTTKEMQHHVFKEQIEFANAMNLPIVLHIRDAYKDSIDILNDMSQYIKSGIYLHCYSGSEELVDEYAKFDAFFGFTGVITFKNAKKGDVIRKVGIDRIFSETDCPYMTPEPFRGKVNRPSYVKYIAAKIALELGVTIDYLEEHIYNNAKRFFGELK